MNLNRFIAKQFASPSGIGGKVVSHFMNRQNLPMYEEVIGYLSPMDSDRILDIGCGNGTVLVLLARGYGGVYAGIDISNSMIKTASRRNRAFVKDGRMTLSVENASTMSFTEGSFSKAYSINTVYFWENLNKTMMEIRRVLAPGGLFINAFYSNDTLARFSHTQFGYKRFTPEQLTDAGIDAGFDVETVPILGGRGYCLLYRGIEN